ncbi:hypothetical protein H6P81_013234 [Aristolochia fimbriata]|uniref:Uncharacterized protein n=1 Tax=Aristolochia fimbriata TaxID=158543 RepID=A0AAV7EHA6_ARIFI|nr:hypothetical protein H6P81_013234 [Aristolochia fimbriata]
MEPYSPHRFAQQFGFCQDLPGFLVSDQHNAGSLSALTELWRWSTYGASVARPCGRVKVPISRGVGVDPCVTLALRDSWLQHVIPIFEHEWQCLTRATATAMVALHAQSDLLRELSDDDEDKNRVNHCRRRRQTVPSGVNKSKAKAKVVSWSKVVADDSSVPSGANKTKGTAKVSVQHPPLVEKDSRPVVLSLSVSKAQPTKKRAGAPAQATTLPSLTLAKRKLIALNPKAQPTI